jgi:hypothetical protein
MLTDALDDCDEDQRDRGLNAGLAMSRVLAATGAPWLFFVDRGVSRGMMAAHVSAACNNVLTYAVSLTGQHELKRVSHGTFCTWWAPMPDGMFTIFANLWTPDAGWSDGDTPAGWRP